MTPSPVSVFYHVQEGHRQATYWGRGLKYQKSIYYQNKQEPTMDVERFVMLFRYLSPWGFGEHSEKMAKRAFRVSTEAHGIKELWPIHFQGCGIHLRLLISSKWQNSEKWRKYNVKYFP